MIEEPVDPDGSDPSHAVDHSLVEMIPEARPSIRKIIIRVVVMVIALGFASFVLWKAFDDLDLASVLDAVRSLEDAERLAMIGATGIVIWAEALMTASMVPGLPARRGALAWLAPTAVSSVVPGPSDMPVFYRMVVSWGNPPSAAATAVAANSVVNITSKLVLPAVAGVVLAVADIEVDGILGIIVSAAAILAVLLAIGVVVLGSERRTAAFGRLLDRILRPTLRLLRRETSGEALADRLVDRRAEAVAVLRTRWIRALASQLLVTGTRVALFVMCIRFVGTPESAVSWQALFCVWAIVRGLTVIPIMPGNAGVSELAYVGMLVPIAGTEYVNEVTAGVLLFRILTWLLMIPAGLVAFGLWRTGLRRQSAEAAEAADVTDRS